MRIQPILIIGLLLLAACAQPQLIDNEPNWTFPDQEPDARPIINRTADPSEWENPEPPGGEVIKPLTNQSVFLDMHEDSTLFRIPLYTPIGVAYPVITRDDVAVLKPAPIRTGDNHFRGYHQFIRFDFGENSTGEVKFFLDESRKKDYLGDILDFKKERPVFEYSLVLDSMPFWDPFIIGSSIMLLGSSYQIQEATEHSLQLNGLDVEQYFTIEDGEKLMTNHKRLQDTQVFYDGFSFAWTVVARDLVGDDELLMREGENLRKRLSKEYREEAIPGLRFNIRYDGLEPIPPEANVTIQLNNRDDRVELSWETAWNEASISIIGYRDDGMVWHGDDSHRLHLRECDSINDGCIKEDDTFILEGRVPDKYGRPGAPTAEVFRFTSLDPDERKLSFRDSNGDRFSVDWEGILGDSRYPAIASLPHLDREYRIWVHDYLIDGNISYGISMDLDGMGGVNGKALSLIIVDGFRVTFDNLITGAVEEPHTLGITFETMPFGHEQRSDVFGILNKEMVRFEVEADEGRFLLAVPKEVDGVLRDQKLYEEPKDEKTTIGMTQWGSRITLEYDDEERKYHTTDDIKVIIPLEQRFALISIGALDPE